MTPMVMGKTWLFRGEVRRKWSSLRKPKNYQNYATKSQMASPPHIYVTLQTWKWSASLFMYSWNHQRKIFNTKIGPLLALCDYKIYDRKFPCNNGKYVGNLWQKLKGFYQTKWNQSTCETTRAVYIANMRDMTHLCHSFIITWDYFLDNNTYPRGNMWGGNGNIFRGKKIDNQEVEI